ncbi:SigE family RNA polymerase sigma factor [Cryptosporangium minutisporangium]|uniref:SigE family RNA polymerase sigma factor n=1 Tax=Cryptosporangium minutisporangium TaxID=113569 RepID=A0ABP6T4J9_9ACTN
MIRRRQQSFEELEALIANRRDAMLATATLLAGGRHAGEDLLQAAIERMIRRWHRVEGDPEAYLRRILYHLAVDSWRQRRRRPELLAVVEPEGQPDGTDAVDLRQALVQALGQLAPRQRAVLVLRYFEELSEAEIAATLGCSTGTVKSTAARGMKRLRELTTAWIPQSATEPNGAPR